MDTNCYNEEIKRLSVGLEDGVYGYQPGVLMKAEELIASNREFEAIVIVFKGNPYLFKEDGWIDYLGEPKDETSSLSALAFILRNQNAIYQLSHKLRGKAGYDDATRLYNQHWNTCIPFPGFTLQRFHMGWMTDSDKSSLSEKLFR